MTRRTRHNHVRQREGWRACRPIARARRPPTPAARADADRLRHGATNATSTTPTRQVVVDLRRYPAAEHLPTILDAATAEGLTVTAALERLMAVEVDATEARRLAGRLQFASLPTTATLAEVDYDAAPGIDPQLVHELATGRYLESATNILART